MTARTSSSWVMALLAGACAAGTIPGCSSDAPNDAAKGALCGPSGADGGSGGKSDGGAKAQDAAARDGDAPPVPDAASQDDDDGGTHATLGPIDLTTAAIYGVYVPIFSANANLAGVTAQLTRIRELGFNVLYLMPVTPFGTSTTAPTTSCGGASAAFGSPYAVKDYLGIEPSLGTAQDLIALVASAHALGMHVILDEVLNHTSWDNALVTQHPEFFLHCDGNRQNPGSIKIGSDFFSDTAQLDYLTKPDVGLRKYMTDMLVSLVKTYDLDGFRFDNVDNPYGANRRIPADFWKSLHDALEATKPGLLMLGEEEDPELAQAPFQLDYGWHLNGVYGDSGLQQVAKGGSATSLQQAWQFDHGQGWPSTMKRMTILQDWDLDEDIKVYGGIPNTLAAATFNFTMDGVPLLFSGEEVGNDKSGLNTHVTIDWNGPNASKFNAFYKSLLALRNGASALRAGAVQWLTNTNAAHVVSYARSDAGGTYVVVINFSGQEADGTLSGVPGAASWKDVSPVGSPGGTTHKAPPAFALQPYDFAVFQAQ